jgi:hypothetical protein
MLKRILNNQLHLHDEGNPAWGVSGAYKRPEGKELPTFKEQLQKATKDFVSSKLDKVKTMLYKASKDGQDNAVIHPSDIDDFTIKWLENEGLTVEKMTSDTAYHNTTYYKISW